MRRDFDQTVTQAEALLRRAYDKQPGRKHQKRPGIKAMQRRANTRKRAAAARMARIRQYKAAMRAYMTGKSAQRPRPLTPCSSAIRVGPTGPRP